MLPSMVSPRYCSKGCARFAESSRLRTRPRVIPVDWSASLTRADARELRAHGIDGSTMLGLQQPAGECCPTTCTREFLEDRGKELRRTGYTVECHADRLPDQEKPSSPLPVNTVLVYGAISHIGMRGLDEISLGSLSWIRVEIRYRRPLCRWKVKIDFGRKVLNNNSLTREGTIETCLLIGILLIGILLIGICTLIIKCC